MPKTSKAAKLAHARPHKPRTSIDHALIVPSADSISPSRFAKLYFKLKRVKGAIVAIAGVGAVASGLVGYYTTYKVVANTQIISSATASANSQTIDSKSIAVLPFVNMSGDKKQEYLSDGISEELRSQLSKIHALRVIARNSSFSFKGKDVGISEIAKKLKVAHVIEGSIRKSGNKIRINAQLIRAADSSQLWSETYERDLADIFAVQDEISAAVVRQLKIQILGITPKAKAIDPRAFAFFLQSGQLVRQRSSDAYTQAIALLQKALVIEPSYEKAWVQLSYVYMDQADIGLRPIAEGYRLSREAANKALAINPDSASAYALLGQIALAYDSDLTVAAAQMKRALTLEPDNVFVLGNVASLALTLGLADQAIAFSEKVLSMDPLSSGIHATLGSDYLANNDLDESIASYRTALSLSQGFIGAHANIGDAFIAKGKLQEALAEIQSEPDESWRLIGLSMVWYALGDKIKSNAALSELIKKYEKESAYNIAYVYAFRGDADRAFEWLNKAVSFQDAGLSVIIRQAQFANIRNDPRWLPFLRKIGKAPEQIAAIKFDVKLPSH
jgi:TolB-like protein/Tfp pilus assembly protein PilF